MVYFSFFIFLSCQDQSYTNPQKAAPELTGAVKNVSPELNSAFGSVLTDYEKIRKALAQDSLEGLEDACDGIVSEAKKAEHAAPDQLKPKLTEVATKAALLRQASKEDMEGARQLFGDLSRPVIDVLRSEPELSKDVYLFECPMAQDYPFWIQQKKGIENPYMGSKMLACGASVNW